MYMYEEGKTITDLPFRICSRIIMRSHKWIFDSKYYTFSIALPLFYSISSLSYLPLEYSLFFPYLLASLPAFLYICHFLLLPIRWLCVSVCVIIHLHIYLFIHGYVAVILPHWKLPFIPYLLYSYNQN